MSLVKERQKLRQKLMGSKKRLAEDFSTFINSNHVDPMLATLVVNNVLDLVAQQKVINALSYSLDEVSVLKKASKKINEQQK